MSTRSGKDYHSPDTQEERQRRHYRYLNRISGFSLPHQIGFDLLPIVIFDWFMVI
jgi:putative alpha-1,2-mannosidase